MTPRPAGNSSAAGLRRLELYASDPARSRRRGLCPERVAQALERARSGEISVSAALREAGLKPTPLAKIQLLAESLNPDELERAITHLRHLQQLAQLSITHTDPHG